MEPQHGHTVLIDVMLAQTHVRLLPGCAHATLHLLLCSTACMGLLQGYHTQRRAEADKGSQCLAAQQQTLRSSQSM